MVSNSRRWLQAYLRGLAQVAFSENPWAGLLVVGSIAVLVPWSAAGAMVGGLVGLVVGRFQKNLGEFQWEAGLAGFNPAIVGILWGLAYAGGGAGPAILVLMLAGCIVIEHLMRPVLARVGLPALSMPAMVTAYLVTGIYAAFDSVFWQTIPPMALGSFSLPLAIVLIGAAMATQSAKATIFTAAIVAVAYGSANLPGFAVLGSQGLWAFTLAPAVFGIYGVFLAGSNRGAVAALFGAGLATLIWIVWVNSPLQSIAQPSLVPFIVGTWITLGVVLLSEAKFRKPRLSQSRPDRASQKV